MVISYTTLTNYTSVESAMTVLHNEGCIIVAAAGNQGESALYYPAAYSEVSNYNSKLNTYVNGSNPTYNLRTNPECRATSPISHHINMFWYIEFETSKQSQKWCAA